LHSNHKPSYYEVVLSYISQKQKTNKTPLKLPVNGEFSQQALLKSSN